MSEQNVLQPETNIIPNHDLIELRNSVDNILKKMEELINYYDEVTRYINTIKVVMNIINSLGNWRCSTCKFNNNGLCMGWKISSNIVDSLRKTFGTDSVNEVGGIQRINIGKIPFIGALCTIYSSKK